VFAQGHASCICTTKEGHIILAGACVCVRACVCFERASVCV